MNDTSKDNNDLPVTLSVIVPCFNAGSTLPELLASLSRQETDLRWELIIADNGSTDETLALTERFRPRLPALQIVDASDRKGAAHARNVAANRARGERLAFVDADDTVAAGWVATIGGALARNELVASRFDGDELNDAATLMIRNCPQQDGLLTFKYSAFLPFASASGLGVKRETFELLGGFDESLVNGEDIDLCWRAQLSGVELCFVEDAVVHYRLRSEPSEIFQQTMNYGYWTVPIYKRYRKHGMPAVSWKSGAKAWMRLVLRLPQLATGPSRTRWLKKFAYRWGLLKGSIAHRTLAL